MNVSINLPDTTSLLQMKPIYFQEALVATLYSVGKLSEKEACSALNMSREELLPKFGFSILADDPDNIELNA
jgi:hypothetical protein